VPTAFGSKTAGTEHISVVVHFPTSLEEFEFLKTIYVGGVAQRFDDLPVSPHTSTELSIRELGMRPASAADREFS